VREGRDEGQTKGQSEEHADGQRVGSAELIIGPMLRHVTADSATVFVETDRPCEVDVLGHHVPTFTVRKHHYALVVIDGLEPATATPYEVRLDGVVRWPLDLEQAGVSLPPSVIRTLDVADEYQRPVRLLFGSCRSAAPHEEPWTLESAIDERGKGVDALWAHALRMMAADPTTWPDLMLMTGDQVYADSISPETRERIERRRADGEDLPPEVVRDFEEYCWLYHESWRPIIERWFFSVVPSAMIFDDHDMIDDWNISESWVDDTRREPWWDPHVIGGLMSYWIYQHLGNEGPDEIVEQGILARLTEASADGGDAWPVLERWARESEEFTPTEGGYRFSYARDLGRVRVVVVDCRNSRVLEHGHRAMVGRDEWDWVTEQCCGDLDHHIEHLVIVTSLPAFVPSALHDMQVWNESVCDGRWGLRAARIGEKIRRGLDLEDWPAFSFSFDALIRLLADVGSKPDAPSTITVVSGDIHFTYVADIEFPKSANVTSAVRQITCSPLRNALTPQERTVIRFALTRTGRAIGWLLRTSVRRKRPPVSWTLHDRPTFANCVGQLTFERHGAAALVEQASMDHHTPKLRTVYECLLEGKRLDTHRSRHASETIESSPAARRS